MSEKPNEQTDTPDAPAEPDAPETPETPDAPDNQEHPSEPDTPQVDDDPDADEGDNPEGPFGQAEALADDPPQDEAPDAKEIEKAFKALGKVRELVARRVGDILGDDATQLIPCPTCQDLAPGFVWPPNVAPLSPEAEAGTLLLLGMQKPQDLQPHPNASLCDTCKGKGQVQTPSLVPGYDVVDCPACAATGRILTSNVVPIGNPTAPAEPTPILTGPTAIPQTLPPEAEALRAQGYMVVPPFDPAAGQPAGV